MKLAGIARRAREPSAKGTEAGNQTVKERSENYLRKLT